MKISIIIVNYNVKYFLSSCLQSVMKAIEGIDAEVYVVDNNSTDQSVEMVWEEFPSVKVIDNKFNAGFSKGNNQAIEVSTGEYILLLNPDTIVEEDCFKKCIDYMDAHAEAGGMGVKMIDGAGKFLPESKRGLPTPSVAFYKIFGLSRLFPKSKIFGKYHLGYLNENETSEIEVMSGAFMLMRKTVVDKIGGLDEAFFMYGEDIDMSYRITQAGYKNIYYPKARIIHFKGESTKKSSVNYVLVFYRAMIIFARKHFSYQNAHLLSFLINMAIYLRASIALINRLFTRIYMPVLDVAVLWTLLFLTKNLYEGYFIGQEGYYPQEVEILAFPLLISCWIFGQLLLGGYHQPVKFKNVFKGLITGASFVLILYAMLDESWRFSRAIVAFSILSTFFFIPLSRIIYMKMGIFKLIRFTEINSALIGGEEEIEKVKNILWQSTERKKKLFYVNPKNKSQSPEETSIQFSGSLYQLKDLIRVYDIDEIIFCMKDVPAGELISIMQDSIVHKCSIYLHPEAGDYILRSSSIHSIGEYILPEDHPQMSHWSERKKRFFEILLCVGLLVLSPFLLLFFRHPFRLISNLWSCLLGKIQLVGVVNEGQGKKYILNAISPYEPAAEQKKSSIDYLMNYGTEKDLEILFSEFGQLDREVN